MQNIELSVTHLRFREADQVEIQLPRFCVFDGSSRVVIEARNEEDARYLCAKWAGSLSVPVKANEPYAAS